MKKTLIGCFVILSLTLFAGCGDPNQREILKDDKTYKGATVLTTENATSTESGFKIYELSYNQEYYDLRDITTPESEVYLVQQNLNSFYKLDENGEVVYLNNRPLQNDARRTFLTSMAVEKFSSARFVDNEEVEEELSKLNIKKGFENKIPRFVREFNENMPEFIPSSYRAAENPPDKEKVPEPKVGDKRDFWVINDIDNAGNDMYVKQQSTLKYIGKKCLVYYAPFKEKSGLKDLQDNELIVLGEKFDKIYNVETNLLGSSEITVTEEYENVIKSPEKISILVFDIDDDAFEGQEYIGLTAGYFYGADLYTDDFLKERNGHSNEDEMFYVDSYCLQKLPNDTYSTLVHEFNHMLNTVNKSFNKNVRYSTWFTEMLSMNAEDVLCSYLEIKDTVQKERIPSFLTEYFYYGFTPWIHDFQGYESYVSCSYANNFAFGAYLMRNYGGIKLMHEIATNGYGDEKAVTEALKACGSKETFETVLAKYTQVLVNNTDKGITMKRGDSCKIGEYEYSIEPIDLWSENFRWALPGTELFRTKQTGLGPIELPSNFYFTNKETNSPYGPSSMLCQTVGTGVSRIKLYYFFNNPEYKYTNEDKKYYKDLYKNTKLYLYIK